MKKKADIYLHKYTTTAIHCQAVFPRDLWKGSLLHQEPVLIVDKKYLLKGLFGSDLDSVLGSRVVGGLTISSECLKGNDCVLKKKKIIKDNWLHSVTSAEEIKVTVAIHVTVAAS